MVKLLIMASLFYPQKNSGGPPISIMNVIQAIKGEYEIYVISKNHEIGSKEPLKEVKRGWNDFDFGKVFYTDYGKHDYKTISSLIEDIKPDVIYQNSFFSHDDLLPVLTYKKKHKDVKVIVAPRGEIYPDRINNGSTKKKNYRNLLKYSGLLKNVYFHVTGEQEKKYTQDFIKIDDRFIYNINNMTFVKEVSNSLKKEVGKIRLVFIARIHPMKNILAAIEILKNVKSEVIYDIYGSIEDAEYWQKCKHEIDKLPNNITVNYCGSLSHDEVPDTLVKYHMFFMPTIGENYGHSIVEALCCGVPVIISDRTPWTDVNLSGCGKSITLDNLSEFSECIDEFAAISNDEYKKMSSNARNYIYEKLDIKRISSQYVQMFNKEV